MITISVFSGIIPNRWLIKIMVYGHCIRYDIVRLTLWRAKPWWIVSMSKSTFPLRRVYGFMLTTNFLCPLSFFGKFHHGILFIGTGLTKSRNIQRHPYSKISKCARWKGRSLVRWKSPFRRTLPREKKRWCLGLKFHVKSNIECVKKSCSVHAFSRDFPCDKWC